MRRDIATAGQDEEETEINLTPMLDVVFIMLIFFIVTAVFVKEAGIDVLRPAAPTARDQANANIIIAISSNNEVWIDRKKVDPQGVRATIEKMLSENPEGAVVIQADQDSYAEVLLSVMDSAREAGVDNVAIAAKRE